jgi:hypothetical protein
MRMYEVKLIPMELEYSTFINDNWIPVNCVIKDGVPYCFVKRECIEVPMFSESKVGLGIEL